MFWHILRILYFIVWFLLLLHCLRRRRFFPILGPGIATKILWLVTFVFFNPLLTLLYLVFGVLLQPLSSIRKHRLAYIGSAIAILLIAVTILFFETPTIYRRSGPVTISDSTSPSSVQSNKPLLRFQAHAGSLRSENNHSTSTFSTHSQNARFAGGSIVILCQDDHLLLDRVARLLQQKLVGQDYIRRITYYPFGQDRPVTQNLPDVFITLALQHIDESRSPIGRKLDATITCQAGTSLYPGRSHTSYPNSPPRLSFGIDSRLQHRSEFTGIESRQARYSQQAKDIVEQIAKGLTNQFDKWINKHGLMPELPEFLYGESVTIPDLPFLKSDSVWKIMSGSGLLINNHSTWMFTDGRSTLDVLKECCAQLRELGFFGGEQLDTESEHLPESFTMSKGNEHVTVFRQSRRHTNTRRIIFNNRESGQNQLMPFVVHYQSLFDKEQMRQAMDKLLEADMDIETVLIFEEQIRRSDQRQRLFSLLETNPAHSMRGCLMLAKLCADDGRTEKALDAFMQARALARMERQHNPETNQFKQVAKQLGDESLATVEIDLEHFRKVGFFDLTDTTEPVSIEKAVDEPAAFCVRNDAGRVGTVVLQIEPIPKPFKPSEQAPQYQLAKIIKTGNSSSIGTSILHGGTTSAYVQDYGTIEIKIESLENKRFIFTVCPTTVK